MAGVSDDTYFEANFGGDYDEISDLAHSLYRLADKFHDRFPMDCRVFGDKQEIGNIAGVSDGDAVRVVKIVEKIHITTVDDANEDQSFYEVPMKRHSVELPEDYAGSFQIASNYPDGYVFETVAELAVDFPQYVRVQDELEIRSQDVFITPGDRLKLVGKGSNRSMQWIECKHIKSGTKMILPSDMTLTTVKKLDTKIYSAKELLVSERFPVKVKKATDIGTTIRGIDLSIPGISDDYDGVFVLYKEKYLEIELYKSGEKIDIPITANLSVIPREIQCGKLESIHELAKTAVPDGKPTFASYFSNEAEDLGLSKDAIVALRSVQRDCILVKGHSTALIIPKKFQGEFKLEGTQFPTPMDLIECKFRGKVRATRTCILKDEYKNYQMSDIFEFDLVKLHSFDYESIALPDGDEVDVIELSRECSTKGETGVVSVPSNLEANFLASPPSLENWTLLKIIHNGWMAQRVSFTSPTDSGLTSEDFLLVKESPLKIIGIHQYTSTFATEVDPKTGEAVITREIPEWEDIKARQLLSGFPPCVNLEKVTPPRSSICQLTPKTYEGILDQLLSPVTYEDPNINLPAGPSVRPSKPVPVVPPKPGNLRRRSYAYGNRDKLPTPPRSPNSADSGFYDRPSNRPIRDRERSLSENEVFMSQTEKEIEDKRRSVSTEETPSRARSAFRSIRRTFSSRRPQLRLSLPSAGLAERPQASNAKTITPVKPPANGDISNFNVDEIAGLMKQLGFEENTVENALTKSIDGNRLCQMNGLENEELKERLRLQTDVQLFTMRHFIDKSTQNWTY